MFERISSPRTVELEVSDLIDMGLCALAYSNPDMLEYIIDLMPDFGQTDFTNFFIEKGIIESTREKLEDDLDIIKEFAIEQGKWKYAN